MSESAQDNIAVTESATAETTGTSDAGEHTEVDNAADVATSAPSQRGAMTSVLSRDLIMFVLLIAIVIVAYFQVDNFGNTRTVDYLLTNALPALLIALPMTLIIITGEIDLSVASIVGVSATTVGALTLHGWSFWPAAAVALVAAIAAGALNGVLIAAFKLPSLAVTIGTLALYRGLALVLIGDQSVSATKHPESATDFIGSTLWGTGIPTTMVFVALVALAFALVLHYSPFGRELYALGYSEEAARFVGVKVARAKFLLYTVSGLIAGIVGLFWSLNFSARSDSGSGLELTVIAAVLLGGVSIFGGRGTIAGAIIGVLMINVITYSLRLRRIPDDALVIITGLLLILSVVGPNVWAAARHALRVRQVQRSLARDEPPGTTVA